MKILMAVAGSSTTHLCINELVLFPMTEKTHVHVIVVCDDSVLSPHKIEQSKGRKIIEEAQSTIAELYPKVYLSAEVRSGPTRTQILQALDTFGADLLLAGARKRHPLAGEWLGSVAAHIAKHAHCSVRLVRPQIQGNRVIACLENIEIDPIVVEEISKMRWLEGSALMLMHVLNIPTAEFSENPKEDARLYFELEEQVKAKMETRLQTYVSQLKALLPQLAIETRVSIEIEPAEVIIEAAKTWKAGTIVVGSHHRPGLDKSLLGSVTEPIVSKAGCSVHIVRKILQPVKPA